MSPDEVYPMGLVAARLADMIVEYADTYDQDDATERAYAIGFRGAADLVRRAGKRGISDGP